MTVTVVYWPDINEENAKVSAAEIEGEEASFLLPRGQLAHVGRVALHTRLQVYGVVVNNLNMSILLLKFYLLAKQRKIRVTRIDKMHFSINIEK